MELTSKQKTDIQHICRKYDIRILALFGSSVNKASAEDLDLAVFPSPESNAPKTDKLHLIAGFDEVFNKKTDIAIIDSATSVTLLFEICQNSLLLYEEEPGAFENERSLAFRKYADAFKIRRLRKQNIDRHVKGLNIVS